MILSVHFVQWYWDTTRFIVAFHLKLNSDLIATFASFIQEQSYSKRTKIKFLGSYIQWQLQFGKATVKKIWYKMGLLQKKTACETKIKCSQEFNNKPHN